MKKNTLDFFDLERAPFARPASHADMYMGDSVSGAISNIYHHICEGEIFALTGPPGSGKSLTIDRTMCAQGVRPVRPLTDRSKLTIPHIHTAILGDLTGTILYGSLEGRARAVRDALRTAGHVVIVLDDAHLISSPTLSGLIALHEICGVFEPLSIALVGLPALLRHMDREPLLYPLRARTARLTTPGVDIRGYITDRVRRAGGDMDAIFTRDGLAHLALPGAGVPVDIAHRVAAVMDAAADVREKVSAPVVRHIEKEAA